MKIYNNSEKQMHIAVPVGNPIIIGSKSLSIKFAPQKDILSALMVSYKPSELILCPESNLERGTLSEIVGHEVYSLPEHVEVTEEAIYLHLNEANKESLKEIDTIITPEEFLDDSFVLESYFAASNPEQVAELFSQFTEEQKELAKLKIGDYRPESPSKISLVEDLIGALVIEDGVEENVQNDEGDQDAVSEVVDDSANVDTDATSEVKKLYQDEFLPALLSATSRMKNEKTCRPDHIDKALEAASLSEEYKEDFVLLLEGDGWTIQE